MNTRDLLQALMDKTGDNPHSLSSKLKGKPPQPQIYKFLTGQSKEPRRTTLQPIADFYNVPVEAFYDDELAGRLLEETITTSGDSLQKLKVESSTLENVGAISFKTRIPVVGTAKMGLDGYYEELSTIPGAGDGHVLAHSDDQQAYALRVKGESMFPAIRHGWYVVVEPNANYENADIVLIKLANGQKMVKSLLAIKQDSLIIESVNGGERQSIDFSELDQHRGIQAVAAILPSHKWRP